MHPMTFLAQPAWFVLAPSADERVDGGGWSRQARTFFEARLTAGPAGVDPAGITVLEVAVAPAATPERLTSVRVESVPIVRAPDVLEAARAAVRAMGGAGFDVLVGRARRVWRIDAAVPPGGDPRAPLLLAGVLASVLLGPILPPEGGALFGVKGARLRLEQQGWGRP
jgi:hypothetical protein